MTLRPLLMIPALVLLLGPDGLSAQSALAEKTATATPPDVLLIIDDVVIGTGLILQNEDLEALNVVSLEVLRPQTATRLYGDLAAKGAVLVRTRAAVEAQDNRTAAAAQRGTVAGATVVRGQERAGRQPLVVVDGVVIGRGATLQKEVMSALAVKNIEVMRGAAAQKAYGSAAEAGVIRITTKPKRDR